MVSKITHAKALALLQGVTKISGCSTHVVLFIYISAPRILQLVYVLETTSPRDHRSPVKRQNQSDSGQFPATGSGVAD